MKSKQFNRYYLFSCLGVLIASYYPLSMGVRVITDMLVNGTVMKENYPKYIIPYTPISVAIIIGVLLMPLFIRFFKKFAFAGGVLSAIGVFFGLELLFEQKVVVSTAETVTKLEDWQMFMCYVPPEGWGETVTTYKTQTAVDILMGDYNPAFKLHFYIISVLLIITILNCLYGFGQMIKNGDKKRCKSLILQSICSVVFLGLCILACFTAFWRDGSIQVSSLSAALMTVFFVLFGVTAGVFVGSFLLGKRKLISVWLPAISASVMTLLMYIGEMILLNGHLYILGSGFLFESLPGIVFAPIDLLVILLSGCITALIFTLLNKQQNCSKPTQKISIIVLAIAVSIVVAVCFLTNPVPDTLANVEHLNLESVKENTVSVLVSDGESYTPIGAVNQELLNELCSIKISGNEISLNRSEDRDKTHTLVLQTAKDTEPTIYSYVKGWYIHFDSTFTSVWVSNDVKPTLSYKVINPQEAKQIYENIKNLNGV